MKTGKHILLLMICFNLITAGIGFVCITDGASCGQNFDNSVLNFFFDYNDNIDLSKNTGLSVNGEFTTNIEGSLTQASGLANIGGSIGYLDVIRMSLGMITLLTPFPLLTMLYALGIPLLFIMLLAVPMFAMYSISIIEFLRGVEF